jgi:hypothetical protein
MAGYLPDYFGTEAIGRQSDRCRFKSKASTRRTRRAIEADVNVRFPPKSGHTAVMPNTADCVFATAPQACAVNFVPTTPITISAMNIACTVEIRSPNRIVPPMMTPTAPRPVHTA